MANYTRRISPDHEASLQDLILTAPQGVQWKRNSWKAIRESPTTGKKEERWFSAGTVGYATARQLAIDWQLGQEVPRRSGNAGRTAGERRQLALTRRLLKDKKEPRFELSIQAKETGGTSWNRMFLGTQNTIAQDRIDLAVATLHARAELFRQLLPVAGAIAAGAAAKKVLAEIKPQRQLNLKDVLAWNGAGEGVSYFPRPN